MDMCCPTGAEGCCADLKSALFPHAGSFLPGLLWCSGREHVPEAQGWGSCTLKCPANMTVAEGGTRGASLAHTALLWGDNCWQMTVSIEKL